MSKCVWFQQILNIFKNCSFLSNFEFISSLWADHVKMCWISAHSEYFQKIGLFHQILNSSHLFQLIMSNIVWFYYILNHFKKWLIWPILNRCKMFLIQFFQICSISGKCEFMPKCVWFEHILNIVKNYSFSSNFQFNSKSVWVDHIKKFLNLPHFASFKMFAIWANFDLFSNCDRFDHIFF
jgi:hypothetical protein